MHSTGRHAGRTVSAAALLAAILVLGVPTGSGATSDRKPPTTPTNLRVTGMSASSVSLAWNPSTDNSGSSATGSGAPEVSKSGCPRPRRELHLDRRRGSAHHLFLRGVHHRCGGQPVQEQQHPDGHDTPGHDPAVDPVVSVRDVGPTHFSLTWSATDDGRFLWYTVFVNGAAVINSTQERSATISSLQPDTTYTVTVQASDTGGNRSPMSNPVGVTTRSQDYVDTTPPTAPTNLWASGHGDREFQLWWTEVHRRRDPAGQPRVLRLHQRRVKRDSLRPGVQPRQLRGVRFQHGDGNRDRRRRQPVGAGHDHGHPP